jgi:alkylation response protein AidB-like acyl-CoA dehydrogenase
MVAPSLIAYGADAQRALLRPMFTGEDIWCQLFSEPGAGSDLAGLATRASAHGDEWIVNGQKVWTTLAPIARWGLLLARSDPEVPKHQGLTAFLLDMHLPGVDVRPLRQMSGGASFSEVYLQDVRLPDSARLGDVGDGWRVALTTMANERVSLGGTVAPRGSGPIADAVRLWVDTPTRDPVMRDRLARLWLDAEVLRLGNVRASQLRVRGTPGPEGSGLKLADALMQQRVAEFVVDLMGPYGMLAEYPYTESGDAEFRPKGVIGFLRAQSATIAGGTSEIMRNVIGERVLGLPGEPRLDRDIPWSQVPRN